MQDKIPVGISFPKEIISRIDSERGDVPRSRYLLRIVEMQYKNSKTREKVRSEEKNNLDLPGSRFESLHPSESQSAIGDLSSRGY